MRRSWLLLIALAAVTLAVVVYLGWEQFRIAKKPIVVGILHSKTGAMRISESSMIDAELLAIEEINARGGLLGRRIDPVVADGKSDWPTFREEARRLIQDHKVSVIFGCWTSASRRTVKPVIEQENHLLVYPMAYEGLEQSPNIIYIGAAPNQQIIPAVKWSFDDLGKRRFFLVGTDYVWPHSVNAIMKDQLKALKAELVGEAYIYFGSSKVEPVVKRIVEAKPDVILSSVVGETNLAFYPELRKAGIRPEQCPVISFSIAEDELRNLSPRDLAGNYSAWNYFQSIERPENRAFVQAFQARYGKDRVTSDVISAAYNGVRLWAQAVEEAGREEVTLVRDTIKRQSLSAPEGIVSIDGPTLHTWRPVYIAKVAEDGQFRIVWDSKKPIRPVPYPLSRSRAEWEDFLQALYIRWNKSWANPLDQTGAGNPQSVFPGGVARLGLFPIQPLQNANRKMQIAN